MAVIGALGDIVFSVSRDKVNTIDNVKWETGVRFAEHDRHLKIPLLEFTGNSADTISFSLYYSVFLGVNPMAEIVKILNAKRAGKAMRFVIGTKAYGHYKWVITKTSKDLERYDGKGNLLVAKVSITLKEYVNR